MKKKFLTGASLLLTALTLVTVTFSWIIETSGTEAGRLVIDYGEGSDNTMIIAPDAIKLALGTKDEDDTFVPVDEYSYLNLSGLYPTSTLTYYMRFTNTSIGETTISVYFQDIITKEVKNEDGKSTSLLDVIYVNGFPTYTDEDDVSSTIVYLPFSDKNRLKLDKTGTGNNPNQYSYLFLSGLKIPPTGKQGYVEYTCKFVMSAEASNVYQDLELSIGTIKIVC